MVLSGNTRGSESSVGSVNSVNLPVMFPSVRLEDVISVVSVMDVQSLSKQKKKDTIMSTG